MPLVGRYGGKAFVLGLLLIPLASLTALATSAAEIDAVRISMDGPGTLGVALGIFLIMFGVALGLRLDDFRALTHHPRRFLVGFGAQVIGLPLATFLLVLLLKPIPSIALGMMVVAACPGGSVSNLFTHLSRGDVAYSVTLTAISSLAAALLTPTLILFWTNAYGPTAALLNELPFDARSFVIQTTLLLALPLALGMSVRAKAEQTALKLRPYMTRAGGAVLAILVFYGAVRLTPVLWPVLGVIGGLAILHNAVAFGMGWLAGRFIDPSPAARRTLIFEVGVQNVGLALVILLAQLEGLGGAMAMAAIWGSWHLIAGCVLVTLYRRHDRRIGA